MNHLLTLNNVLSKYLIFIILGFSCIAYIVPEYFTWAIAYTPFLLGIAMFGMGLTIKFESLCSIFRHPKDICIGVLAQYTIMPLLAWGICHIFTLSPDIVIGVILVGCCPGGTASNVITYIANGDVPLSVGITITSTLKAPIVTPLLIL
ncbi:MAG: bile acid:sodium symporter family protein, partial [Veillonella parvula]